MLNPMQLMFLQVLEEMDAQTTYLECSLNHHANGMDYLCLKRDTGVTLKLYLIREKVNANSGFLVNPHPSLLFPEYGAGG